MSLNFYEIARALNGTIAGKAPARFGGFGWLQTTAAALKVRPRTQSRSANFDIKDDRRIVSAFERIRQGTAPDRLLWDPDLRLALAKRLQADRSSVDLSAAVRRLIQVRKSKAYYQKRGVELGKTTVKEPQASIVDEFAHVIEFALMKMKLRYSASIDDILISESLVSEFEHLARSAAPELTSQELRLGALYIRKTRRIGRDEASMFDELDVQSLEQRMDTVGTLASKELATLPESPGLLKLWETSHSLFISRTSNLRLAASRFQSTAFAPLLGNQFWTPDPTEIKLDAFVGNDFHDVAIGRWQVKLIQVERPTFNWPVR